MPGIYKVTLSAQEMNGDFICVSGVSGSAGVVVYPAFIQTERGDLNAITALINQVIGAIPEDIAGKADVLEISGAVNALSSAVNNILGMIQSLSQSVDAVSAAVNNGVKLNGEGKNAVKEQVKDGFGEITLTELDSVPDAANPLLAQALMLQYMALRNKSQNSAREVVIYKSGDEPQPLARAALNDVDNVFTRYGLGNP
jgi:hypothetical protein